MKSRHFPFILAAAFSLWACTGDLLPEGSSRIYKNTDGSEPVIGETLRSSESNQNAVYVSAGTLNVYDCIIRKSGDGSSLAGGSNAAVLVTGTGWLVMKGSSSVSGASFAPALAVTGGKAGSAMKISSSILSTTAADSPAIYMEKGEIIMDEGQISTDGNVAAIMVPKGAAATLTLNGVICECPILAQVGGTLNLKLGQYGSSEIKYTGAIQILDGGKVVLEDPYKIWKGATSGSGKLERIN
jgi:hypothetical protein